MNKQNISHIDPEYESELKIFSPDNPDIQLIDLVDEEVIRLSGSKLLYYKYYPSEDHDDVYMENRNKTIAKEPIIVYGHYDPQAIEENILKFGVQQESQQIFTFNKNYITRKLGRVPIAGDILKSVFQNIKFQIFEVQDDAFDMYGIYHTLCTGKILRDSEEAVDTNLTQTSDKIGNKDNV